MISGIYWCKAGYRKDWLSTTQCPLIRLAIRTLIRVLGWWEVVGWSLEVGYSTKECLHDWLFRNGVLFLEIHKVEILGCHWCFLRWFPLFVYLGSLHFFWLKGFYIIYNQIGCTKFEVSSQSIGWEGGFWPLSLESRWPFLPIPAAG